MWKWSIRLRNLPFTNKYPEEVWRPFESVNYWHFTFSSRADLGGGCRGCAPPTPPWDDLRFSNTTGILQKKKYVVYWCWSSLSNWSWHSENFNSTWVGLILKHQYIFLDHSKKSLKGVKSWIFQAENNAVEPRSL